MQGPSGTHAVMWEVRLWGATDSTARADRLTELLPKTLVGAAAQDKGLAAANAYSPPYQQASILIWSHNRLAARVANHHTAQPLW